MVNAAWELVDAGRRAQDTPSAHQCVAINVGGLVGHPALVLVQGKPFALNERLTLEVREVVPYLFSLGLEQCFDVDHAVMNAAFKARPHFGELGGNLGADCGQQHPE